MENLIQLFVNFPIPLPPSLPSHPPPSPPWELGQLGPPGHLLKTSQIIILQYMQFFYRKYII
jgi:hypothetical protein